MAPLPMRPSHDAFVRGTEVIFDAFSAAERSILGQIVTLRSELSHYRSSDDNRIINARALDQCDRINQQEIELDFEIGNRLYALQLVRQSTMVSLVHYWEKSVLAYSNTTTDVRGYESLDKKARECGMQPEQRLKSLYELANCIKHDGINTWEPGRTFNRTRDRIDVIGQAFPNIADRINHWHPIHLRAPTHLWDSLYSRLIIFRVDVKKGRDIIRASAPTKQ